MEKLFVFAIIFMLIVVIVMFFFILQLKTGVSKDVQGLKSELDKVSGGLPVYHPLALSSAFLKLILSFISLFLPSS